MTRKTIPMFLKNEITAHEQHLYICAKELEESAALKKEMSILDHEFEQDGIDNL